MGTVDTVVTNLARLIRVPGRIPDPVSYFRSCGYAFPVPRERGGGALQLLPEAPLLVREKDEGLFKRPPAQAAAILRQLVSAPALPSGPAVLPRRRQRALTCSSANAATASTATMTSAIRPAADPFPP